MQCEIMNDHVDGTAISSHSPMLQQWVLNHLRQNWGGKKRGIDKLKTP